MANPIFELLGRNQNHQLQQLINLYKSGGNPLSMVNPQMAQMLNGCNGNYKDLFYNMCKQQGVNPEQIINMFR